MWRRQQPYWHAVFAIVWAAALVVTLLDDPGPHGRAPSVLLLVVIGLAYAVLGTRAMTSRDLAEARDLPSVARGAFSRIARAVEISLFGGRAIDAGAWKECRDAYAELTVPKNWARA